MQWALGRALLKLDGCAKVRLAQVGLSGFTQKGASLLQISGAALLEVTGCRVSGYAGENLAAHQEKLFEEVTSLEPMQKAFSVDDGAVFAPVNPKIADIYAAFNDAQREEMGAPVIDERNEGLVAGGTQRGGAGVTGLEPLGEIPPSSSR